MFSKLYKVLHTFKMTFCVLKTWIAKLNEQLNLSWFLSCTLVDTPHGSTCSKKYIYKTLIRCFTQIWCEIDELRRWKQYMNGVSIKFNKANANAMPPKIRRFTQEQENKNTLERFILLYLNLIFFLSG